MTVAALDPSTPAAPATETSFSAGAEETLRPPCTFVIFGASGDLTRRLLAPAIAHLSRDGAISPEFAIVGIARSPLTDPEFRAYLAAGAREHTPPTQGRPGELPGVVRYLAGDFGDPDLYLRLRAALDEIEARPGRPRNRIFYLATPPETDPVIVTQLGDQGLAAPGRGWSRVVVEKPFGHDLASGAKLNADVRRVFDERQIYRIDHYLGKETVQNIFVLRFANGIFEPLWNRRYIDHVQITVAESLGVEHRAGYYEKAGVIRDMFQNHLMQLLCLTAMEPPAAFEADAVRAEKVKVLQSIRPFPPDAIDEWAVRGQYGAGGRGRPGRCRVTARSRRWPPTRRPRRGRRSSSRSTTGAGPACRSTSGPASAWSSASRRSRSSSSASRTRSSAGQTGTLNPNVLRLRIQPDEGRLAEVRGQDPRARSCRSSR